ncbi:response regulator [Nanoarchaeota archaeon]
MANILYADDNYVLADMTARTVRRAGHDVTIVSDGQKALDKIRAEKGIELLITDMEMPNLDGYGLINTLNTEGYKLPILVVASEFDHSKVTYAGPLEYLQKASFGAPELREKVNTMLED